jgi:hypothetical protein
MNNLEMKICEYVRNLCVATLPKTQMCFPKESVGFLLGQRNIVFRWRVREEPFIQDQHLFETLAGTGNKYSLGLARQPVADSTRVTSA